MKRYFCTCDCLLPNELFVKKKALTLLVMVREFISLPVTSLYTFSLNSLIMIWEGRFEDISQEIITPNLKFATRKFLIGFMTKIKKKQYYNYIYVHGIYCWRELMLIEII